MCCVADLQSAARRDRGAGRGAGGPQDHRDQRAERGGRAAREDRQPPRYLRGRGQYPAAQMDRVWKHCFH